MPFIKKSPSIRSRILSAMLKYKSKNPQTKKGIKLDIIRQKVDDYAQRYRVPKDIVIESLSQGDIRGEWQIPDNAPTQSCIFYLHGGGYTIGSPGGHRAMTVGLAQASTTKVFSLDYRLSPENRFPAAVDDALLGYNWLLEQGFSPSNIVVAGDSAGGGLAMALMLKLKDHNISRPSGVILLSPWTDLSLSGDSVMENGKKCAMLNKIILQKCAESYLNGEDSSNPMASPLFGDMSGMPPLLIYVSTTEAIRDDSLRLEEKAKKSGVQVKLNIWNKQPHAWPAFYPFTPESKQCVLEMGDFVKECLG